MNDFDDINRQMQNMSDTPHTTERLDQISMFLQFIEKNRPINMLVSKEKSIGYIQESHMAGHIEMDRTIMTNLVYGQVRKAYEHIYSVNSEFRTTMSIDGRFIENITKQELRYTHTQHLIQEQKQQQQKKGFLKRN